MPTPPNYAELEIYFQCPITGCEARCRTSPKHSGRIGDHWRKEHSDLGPWNGRNVLVKTRNQDGTCKYIALIHARLLLSNCLANHPGSLDNHLRRLRDREQHHIQDARQASSITPHSPQHDHKSCRPASTSELNRSNFIQSYHQHNPFSPRPILHQQRPQHHTPNFEPPPYQPYGTSSRTRRNSPSSTRRSRPPHIPAAEAQPKPATPQSSIEHRTRRVRIAFLPCRSRAGSQAKSSSANALLANVDLAPSAR